MINSRLDIDCLHKKSTLASTNVEHYSSTPILKIHLDITKKACTGNAYLSKALSVATSYPRRERSPNYFRRVEA